MSASVLLIHSHIWTTVLQCYLVYLCYILSFYNQYITSAVSTAFFLSHIPGPSSCRLFQSQNTSKSILVKSTISFFVCMCVFHQMFQTFVGLVQDLVTCDSHFMGLHSWFAFAWVFLSEHAPVQHTWIGAFQNRRYFNSF